MMTNMNISLPGTLKEYVEDRVNYGGYGTVSDYTWSMVKEIVCGVDLRRLKTES